MQTKFSIQMQCGPSFDIPPPAPRTVDDMCTLSPYLRDQESSIYTDNIVSCIAVPKDIGTRADVIDSETECNVLKESITFVKKPASDVTVNGISLMQLMRMKKDSAKKKTPVRKKLKIQEDKKTQVTVPPVGSIDKYLMKKNEEKLTFTNSTPGKKNSVRDRIQSFQELSKTVGGGVHQEQLALQ